MSLSKIYECYICPPDRVNLICDGCGKSLLPVGDSFLTEAELRAMSVGYGWQSVKTEKGMRDFCLNCHVKRLEMLG